MPEERTTRNRPPSEAGSPRAAIPDSPLPIPDWLDRSEYPFTSRWAELPDGRIHYVDEGTGPATVFVHGTPTWSFEYRHVIRAAMDTGRCIAPDHLGFGLSERPRTATYTPEAHAERLRQFVDAIGLDRFALVVHDFGGPIGLPLALNGRVTRVVILNSWMWPFEDDKEMTNRARFAGSAMGRWMYRNLNASLRMIMPSAYAHRSRLTRAIHKHYLEPFRNPDDRVLVLWALAQSLLGSASYYRSLFGRVDSLRRIPVSIIWGLRDTAFRPNILARWRSALPEAAILTLDHAGHWPHEEAPSEVAEAIAKFLVNQ
jgi:haloalkane dehalogenase